VAARILAAIVLAGTAFQAAPARTAVGRNVCDLLQGEEIRSVQQVELKDRKASEQVNGGMRFAHCFFATTDFSHSISLSLITAQHGPHAVRRFWEKTFEAEEAREDGKEDGKEDDKQHGRADKQEREEGEQPARRVEAGGGEAFWTGDQRAGALYVLSDDAVLRISVGGVQDEAERISRSRTLVEAALRRLRTRR
jgi:hypothetical protein